MERIIQKAIACPRYLTNLCIIFMYKYNVLSGGIIKSHNYKFDMTIDYMRIFKIKYFSELVSSNKQIYDYHILI